MNLLKLSMAASVAALLAGAATAQQTSSSVVIDQVNLRTPIGNLNVVVDNSETQVVGVNTSTANSVDTNGVTGDLKADIVQTGARAITRTNINVGHTPTLVAQTTTQVNGITTEVYDANNYTQVSQETTGDAFADSRITSGQSDVLTTVVTSTSNLVTASSYPGRTEYTGNQLTSGDTIAGNGVRAENSYYAATLVTTAVANSVKADATDGVGIFAEQAATGDNRVEASSAGVFGTANDVYNTTTATANNISGYTDYGHAALGDDYVPTVQSNGVRVEARARTDVGYLNGYSSTSSLALGNSASLTNGAQGGTLVNLDQFNNGGGVSATTTFRGDGGSGAAFADATAAGNSAHITAVNNGIGSGHLGAQLTQTNQAPIRARTQVNAGYIGSVTASATAIGNTATVTGATHLQQGSD